MAYAYISIMNGVGFLLKGSNYNYYGKALEAFTHAETPWLATRGDLPATVSTDRKI